MNLARKLATLLAVGAVAAGFSACGYGNTVQATNITATSATLNANANCGAGDSGVRSWGWRVVGQAGWQTTNDIPWSCGSSDQRNIHISQDIANLRPSTQYEYKICSTSSVFPNGLCVNANGGGDGSNPANPPQPLSRFTTLAAFPCDFYASPSGSDSNTGTSPTNAFRSVDKLDSVLSADKKGCLETGDYGNSSTLTTLQTGGISGHPAILTADTGANPVVHGGFRIWSNNITVSNIKFDATYPLSPRQDPGCSSTVMQTLVIEASNVTFTHNDVTSGNAPADERAGGIGVAWQGPQTNITITYNKIHDFGSCDQFDHGIYYDHATNGTIANNWIWNGPCSYGNSGGDHTRGCGAGIQLYSDPSNTQVYNNVIDGAGVGCYCYGSNNNIHHNIFLNLRGIYYANGGFAPGYVISSGGSGNSFAKNLWWNAPGGCSCAANNLNAHP